MTEPTRYIYVGNDWDAMEIDMNHGPYVKFEDYEKRVNSQLKLLEVAGHRIEQLEEDLRIMTNVSKRQTKHIDSLHVMFLKANELIEGL